MPPTSIDDRAAAHDLRRRTLLRLIEFAFNRDTRSQTLMFVFCVLFGLALIAETQGAGDGIWYWYASLLQGGDRLYSHMHVALQPLFVLETEFFMALLGKGWVASKVPAVIHLLAYCLALLLLVRRSKFTDPQKAAVLACGFFFPLGFEAYRFDDYHVVADCFQLYSLIALLALPQVSRLRNLFFLACALGALCGLSITTRLNDGLALFLGVTFGIAVLATRHRIASLMLFTLTTCLTIVAVVHLTGDSLHDYANFSILRAASSKGGAGSVLIYPLALPLRTLGWMFTHWAYDLLTAYILICAMVWTLLFRPLHRRHSKRELWKAAFGVVLILLPYPVMRNGLLSSGPAPSTSVPLVSVTAVATILIYVLGMLVVVRLFRWLANSSGPYKWDPREILFLVPIGQFASGSMSSGGVHYQLYGPVGVLAVLLSICPPFHFQIRWLRTFAIAVATILIATTALFKYNDPFSWHTYREHPLFSGRTLYRHPVYGPMIIDRDLVDLMQPICSTINARAPHPQLLSLPYPYANYFCVTPPWDGYVQTFFDTSSKETIRDLMGRLDSAPPTWILYQRQLSNLSLHERVFNGGQPLQQRYLDQMIEKKIDDGTWQIIYASSYGDSSVWDNRWLLILTVPRN
jgi:hypothetical protein